MVERVKRCTHLQIFAKCSKIKQAPESPLPSSFFSFSEQVNNEPWESRGRSELIKCSRDPIFQTPLSINYFFQENQKIKCDFHCDFKIDINESDDLPVLSSFEFFIGQLLGSPGQTLNHLMKTEDGSSLAYIVLKAEHVVESNDKVYFQVNGKKLEDVSGLFVPFEPFFVLYRCGVDGNKEVFYTSEYENGKNVSWKGFEKNVQELCRGNYEAKIGLDVFDHKTLGEHEYIASTFFNLNQLLIEKLTKFTLVNEKKLNRSGYSNSGFIVFESVKITTVYSFLDYIKGGCHIHLDIAIDFTGSNKHPSSVNSLHYIDKDPEKLNHYQQALKAVSEILLPYNSEQKAAVYGFGGKINNVISHCFPLNQDPDNPFVYGVNGILEVYKEALNYVGLSGPTRFSELLKTVIQGLEAELVQQFHQSYKFLLILTDGEIDDMQESINWIVRGTACPLSIVIVGIGNENFEKMKILDADDLPLVDTEGKKMLRDIVQFVPFREVNNSPALLVEAVLDEIPREIKNFFKMKGIKPNPPVEAPVISFKSNVEELV